MPSSTSPRKEAQEPTPSSQTDTTDNVRVVLNNALVPIKEMKACEGSMNGPRPINAFVGAVSELTKDAVYQEARICYSTLPNRTLTASQSRPKYVQFMEYLAESIH